MKKLITKTNTSNEFIEDAHTKISSNWQRQAIIKLTEKKDRDKRYIKKWRPVSLLNVDTKTFSKAISKKLKTVLPTLISSQQTAYVKHRLLEKVVD